MSNNHYAISQYRTACQDFRQVFGTNFNPFLASIETVVMKYIIIDPIAFDDYLHREHGDYESRGLSMSDIVREKYGKEGDELLNKLL